MQQSTRQDRGQTSLLAAALPPLCAQIEALTVRDGRVALPFDGGVFRASCPDRAFVYRRETPCLTFVVQGGQSFWGCGGRSRLDAGKFCVCALDLPLSVRVVRAGAFLPCLGIRLELDPCRIAALVPKVFPYGVPSVTAGAAFYTAVADVDLVRAFGRLLEMAAEDRDGAFLAPCVVDEILVRLLRGPFGMTFAQSGAVGSPLWRIARVTSWLGAHFREPVSIHDLSALAAMGASSFHEHFRALTAMSPLQFQKYLRLQEARRLMLSVSMDATMASREVGYISVSQFSREYARLFGRPPVRDIAFLRGKGQTLGGAG